MANETYELLPVFPTELVQMGYGRSPHGVFRV